MQVIALISNGLFPNAHRFKQVGQVPAIKHEKTTMKTISEIVAPQPQDTAILNKNRINMGPQELLVAEIMEEDRRKMIAKIKEYSVFKDILDRNAQMIVVSKDSLQSLDIAKQYHYDLLSQKFKIVDCKLFYNLLLDL